MKTHYLVLFLFFFTLTSHAQRFDWVSFTPLVNGDPNSGSGGLGVEKDSENNLYSVTMFTGQIDVGGTILTQQGPQSNLQNILLIKWNSDGEVLAYKQIAQQLILFSGVSSLEYDEANDHILLSVSTQGSPLLFVDEDITINTGWSVIMRFDTDLQFISSTNRGTTYSVPVVTHNGFMYDASGYNSTITKMDSEYNVIWTLPLTMSWSGYYVDDMVITTDNRLVVIGHYIPSFFHTAIGYNGLTVTPATFERYCIIFTFDLDGNPLDVSDVAPSPSQPMRISSDEQGNLYAFAPYSQGGIDVEGFTLEPLVGATEAYIAKLDSNLDVQWITELHHTGGNMEPGRIVVHPSGKVTAIGLYRGNATMGAFPLDPSQYGSGFLVQCDPSSGSIQYATNFGPLGAGTGRPYDIELMGDKYLISGLSYGSSITPGATARYGCFTETYTTQYLTCFNDIDYTHEVNITNDAGQLTVNSTGDGVSYQWYLNEVLIDGATESSFTPSESGLYQVIATDQYNCATEDEIDFETCQNTTATDVQNACEPFTWIDGITYTEDNSTATFVIPNSAGCDSLITLNLTVTIINAAINVGNASLAAAQDGAEYQWVDCELKGSAIEGATGQVFTPLENGSYGVEITLNDCSVFSECEDVIIIGIDEQADPGILSVYPNPADDQIQLNTAGLTGNSEVIITDMTGKTALRHYINSNLSMLDVSALSEGMYILTVYNDRVVTNATLLIAR